MIDDPATSSWHFDKRIPIALIVAIGLQMIAVVWWASRVNEYMYNETNQRIERDNALSERINSVTSSATDSSQRLIRIETLMDVQRSQMEEQKRLLTEINRKVQEVPGT